MDPNYDEAEIQLGQTKKKVKVNEEEKSESDGGWIVVNKKKNIPLTVSISDFSKINRFYSHKTIQNYLRYLLTQLIPNPMWLLIRRQSLIEQILYIDLQIENNLFQDMIASKQLSFLGSITNQTNKATFKPNNKIYRQDLWECLLCNDSQPKIEDMLSNKNIEEMSPGLTQQLYNKYSKYILTSQQLKGHLYPNKSLPLYNDYYNLQNIKENTPQLKNKILIIDCEMVSSVQGFQLARATIANFEGQIIFDQLFKPQIDIVNYNTEYSGITKQMLDPVTNTMVNKLYPFLETVVCEETIMVGHSLQNDLRAMKLIYDKVIDSSVLFMRKNGTKLKLKSLADKILKRKIQIGEHDSAQDCLATLHLIRAKIQNQDQIKKKDYDLLRQMQQYKKNAAFIDYAIDYQMKQYNGNHFQKTNQSDSIQYLFKLVKKYMQKDIATPDIVLTRIQKKQDQQWQQYYRQFDEQYKKLHESLPKMTLIFLNCQINPNVQIVNSGATLKPLSTSRSPCFVLAV